jgi:hypothetical protein
MVWSKRKGGVFDGSSALPSPSPVTLSFGSRTTRPTAYEVPLAQPHHSFYSFHTLHSTPSTLSTRSFLNPPIPPASTSQDLLPRPPNHLNPQPRVSANKTLRPLSSHDAIATFGRRRRGAVPCLPWPRLLWRRRLQSHVHCSPALLSRWRCNQSSSRSAPGTR